MQKGKKINKLLLNCLIPDTNDCAYGLSPNIILEAQKFLLKLPRTFHIAKFCPLPFSPTGQINFVQWSLSVKRKRKKEVKIKLK